MSRTEPNKTREQLLQEAWIDNGLAMETARLEVMIDIRDALVQIEKRLGENSVVLETELTRIGNQLLN